jgi:hypothetical protein
LSNPQFVPKRDGRYVYVHVYVLATFTCEVAWMALVASSCVRGPVDLSMLVFGNKRHFKSRYILEEKVKTNFARSIEMKLTLVSSLLLIVHNRMFSELAG